MQLKNTFFFAMTLGLFSAQVLAADVTIQNLTSHKVESHIVLDPQDASHQMVGFSIDGKPVLGFEALFILEVMSMLSEEERAEAMKDEAVSALLAHQPLFIKADNQKVVFSYSKELCEEFLAAVVTTGDKTQTFCFLNDPEVANGTVWLFQDKSQMGDR